MEKPPERSASQTESEDRPVEVPGEAAEQTAEPRTAESQAAETSAEPAGEPVRSEAEAVEAALAEPMAADAEAPRPTEPMVAEPTATAETEVAAEAPADESPVAETVEVALAETVELPAAERPEVAEAATVDALAAPARPEKPAGLRLASLRPGMLVEGTVTRVERYGAFVDLKLAERRDGLIHISELASHRVRRVEDVVQAGDSVRARVVSVDLDRGRIGLSLKDVAEESYSQNASTPEEPALSSIALAFERARDRKREREEQGQSRQERENAGDRKRREHEELMRRLRSGGV